MYYYAINGSIIEKYLISFDQDEVRLIREEIARNCSQRNKGSFIGTQFNVEPSTGEIFENIREEKMDSNNETLYSYEYDIVKVPKIVQFIDELLNGNSNAYYYIKNYIVDDRDLDQEILEATEDYVNISSDDSVSKSEGLDKIGNLVDLMELNAGVEPMQPYYDALMEAISIQFIGSLRSDKIDEVATFINYSWSIQDGSLDFSEKKDSGKQYIKE